MSELDNLDVLNEDGSVSLESEDYLIYKLEKDCHVTISIPANEFTKHYFDNEIKKIEKALD